MLTEETLTKEPEKSKVAEVLQSPFASSKKIQEILDSQLSYFRDRFSTETGLMLLLGAREHFLTSSYNIEGESELSRRVWQRLKSETDVVDNWLLLDDQLDKLPGGVFVGDAEKLKERLGTHFSVGKSSKEYAGYYKSLSNSVTLTENTLDPDSRIKARILHKVLLHNFGSDYSDSSMLGRVTSMSPLDTLAHELNHKNTSSLMTNRVGMGQVPALTRELLARLAVKDPRDVKNFEIRTTILERDMLDTAIGEFLAETIADLAEMETGTRAYTSGYTTDRSFGTESYKYMKNSQIPKEKFEILEKKVVALSGTIGWSAPLMGRVIRSLMLEEFESQKNKTLNKFLTPDYLENLLNHFIRNASSILGMDYDKDPDGVTEEFLKRAGNKSQLRYLMQRGILLEEAIKILQEEYKDGPILVGSDDVFDDKYDAPTESWDYVDQTPVHDNHRLRLRITRAFNKSDAGTHELGIDFDFHIMVKTEDTTGATRIIPKKLNEESLGELGISEEKLMGGIKHFAEAFRKANLPIPKAPLFPKAVEEIKNMPDDVTNKTRLAFALALGYST